MGKVLKTPDQDALRECKVLKTPDQDALRECKVLKTPDQDALREPRWAKPHTISITQNHLKTNMFLY